MAELADDKLRTDRRALNLRPLLDAHLAPIVAEFQLDAVAASQLRDAVAALAAESPIQPTLATNALDGLIKYIPTESMTLYVAATAAMPSIDKIFTWLSPFHLYAFFMLLTPILFLLIYIGKRRALKLRFLPLPIGNWPWWKLIASTIAFAAWALAIPPLIESDAGKVIAGFGALFVSTLLSVIGGVVESGDS